MREGFAAGGLRCPVCHVDRSLRLHAEVRDEREIREGTLGCLHCGAEIPVRRGVGELLVAPADHVAREAAGLERFAEMMRNEGWTPDRIRALPHIDSGYWWVQAVSFDQLVREARPRAGQSLLDLGSNTCWASNRWATLGLDVVALDISLAEMQGLWTADYFIDHGGPFFERVLGSMDDLPLASESLDFVFACEVLHHNDLTGLHRTMAEAFRVLKPGGRVLVVNETLKTLRDRHGVHVDHVADFDGYEHAHWAHEYRGAARRAGFRVRTLEPLYHSFFKVPDTWERPAWPNWRGQLAHLVYSSPLGRRLYTEWLDVVTGGVGLGLVATKPV